MRLIWWVSVFLFALSGPLRANDLPVIRVAVLKIGTVNWELATIKENGFDRKNGFDLEGEVFQKRRVDYVIARKKL